MRLFFGGIDEHLEVSHAHKDGDAIIVSLQLDNGDDHSCVLWKGKPLPAVENTSMQVSYQIAAIGEPEDNDGIYDQWHFTVRYRSGAPYEEVDEDGYAAYEAQLLLQRSDGGSFSVKVIFEGGISTIVRPQEYNPAYRPHAVVSR
jgi:hypothetical protein